MGSHPLPAPATPAGQAGLAALLAEPGKSVVALDFDGTLAPIVPDPDRARAHPGAVPTLARLAPRLGSVAVITGRPAAVAVRYGGFVDVAGLEHLVVLGHYGAERWDAASGDLHGPGADPGVRAAQAELPGLLAGLAGFPQSWAENVHIEDKNGRAVAVHTRRTDDPQGALNALHDPLAELAARHGLVVEPGRMVLELRPPGMDKGMALVSYVRQADPAAVLYAGDDLGDLAAFDAVDRLRADGLPGLLVCSGSTEVADLAARADLVVPGPSGMVELLAALADAVSAPR